MYVYVCWLNVLYIVHEHTYKQTVTRDQQI